MRRAHQHPRTWNVLIGHGEDGKVWSSGVLAEVTCAACKAAK